MLLYTAELKRSTQEPLEEKKAAVEELLTKLSLQRCRDVKVGEEGEAGGGAAQGGGCRPVCGHLVGKDWTSGVVA